MYFEMLDGLRGHYEKKLGAKRSAGYQAAMSLSFLFGITIVAIFIIADAALTGSLHGTMWLYEHKIIILAFGVLTAWGHVRYSKLHGVYNKKGPATSKSWRAWFVGYCMVSVILSGSALLTAYLVRPKT